jgi:hypothetical protein
VQKFKSAFFLIFIFAFFCTGCSGQASQKGAPGAVATYIQALVERDENRAVAASCADWEAQAKVEYNSFSAVNLKLDGLSCQTIGQEDLYTLVKCNGSIIANYGAEDLNIDIASRTYRAVEEGGEWRMCGYSKQ